MRNGGRGARPGFYARIQLFVFGQRILPQTANTHSLGR